MDYYSDVQAGDRYIVADPVDKSERIISIGLNGMWSSVHLEKGHVCIGPCSRDMLISQLSQVKAKMTKRAPRPLHNNSEVNGYFVFKTIEDKWLAIPGDMLFYHGVAEDIEKIVERNAV